MVEYFKNIYGEEVDIALAEFKSTEAFIDINQTMNDLSVSDQTNSGRLQTPTLRLDAELRRITQSFVHVNTTENFRNYVDGVNSNLTSITDNFMEEVNQNSIEIDGEYFISIDLLNDNHHATRLKSKIVQIENEIITDGTLTNEEK